MEKKWAIWNGDCRYKSNGICDRYGGGLLDSVLCTLENCKWKLEMVDVL